MASKVQQQLDFPVRKSGRQSKPSKKALDSDDKLFSPLKQTYQNGKRGSTPHKASMRNQPEVSDTSSPHKSPSKRKPNGLMSPPTPPKSPCKGDRKIAVSRTPPCSRSSSPEICSEESEDELVEQGSVFCRAKHHKQHQRLPHNQVSPSKSRPTGTNNAACKTTGTGNTTSGVPYMNKGLLQRSGYGFSSPSKQKYEHLSSQSTPPKSPLKVLSPSHRHRSISQDSVIRSVLPCTPTKSPSKSRMLSPEKTQMPNRVVLSPRKTPSKGNNENFVLKSPKLLPKLQITKPDSSGYRQAKQSLHTAKPDHLVGRDQEVAEISGFLKTHLEKGSAGSLYISGAPGTGKTAAALHIIDDFKVQHECQIAYLNCMMLKDVTSVFRRLHSELSGKGAAGKTTVKDMEKLVTTSKHSMILVLDEIDQLDSKNQEVLYTIFEWPSLDNSKLILVGVANALDLTDRILPRLQAKPQCRPKLLHFAPYTRNQITAIITDRLSQTGAGVVENSAIQFCARKVSAVAGDMRKALDVCRRAVELAESEMRSQAVLKISDCNSPSKSKPGSVKKMGVAHISKVMSEVYGSSVQAQQSEGVPLQQKLLVCTLLLAVKTGKFKEILLGKLHETYCKVCRRQQMTPVDQSEFHSLCVLLEARGVIGMKKAKETRLIKVTLRQDEKELEQTLQDRILVSAILKEGLPK